LVGVGVAGLSSDPESRAGEGNKRNDYDDDVRKERGCDSDEYVQKICSEDDEAALVQRFSASNQTLSITSSTTLFPVSSLRIALPV